MEQATGQTILDRWSEDTAFRASLRTDAVTAISGIGVSLTDEDREFLRSVDWTLSDEELEAILEKAFYC